MLTLEQVAPRLRCLECGSSLVLGPEALACSGCPARYPRRGDIALMRRGDSSGSVSEEESARRRFYDGLLGAESDCPHARRDATRRRVVGMLERYPVRPGGMVLDIGAGSGQMKDVSPWYVGLDYSSAGLERHLGGVGICASGSELPFADGSVSWVVSVATIEHIPEPDECLAEIDRALEPGGFAYLAPSWFCRPWVTRGIGVRAWSDLSFVEKLERLSIPLRENILWQTATVLPRRVAREIAYALARGPLEFRYVRLRPSYEVFYGTDSDACAWLDSHECALYFLSRGYEVLNGGTLWRRLRLRHEPVMCRKPGPA